MAPKSAPSKKGKKALKEPTPISKRGTKRKTKGDSSKLSKRRKGKQTEEEEDVFLDNTIYFEKKSNQDKYEKIFSSRVILNGRWIDYAFFAKEKFAFEPKFEALGWKSITLLKDDVYPEIVGQFYAHVEKETGEVNVISYVKGETITLTKGVICQILKIGSGGQMDKKDVSRKTALSALLGKEITDDSFQPMANDLPLELRLVHHFICHILIPKGGKFDYITERELFFLWAYLTDTKIDLPEFILEHIVKASRTKVSLPYGILLTKIFKHFKIDLRGEKHRTPDSNSDEYNQKTLSRMGYHFNLT